MRPLTTPSLRTALAAPARLAAPVCRQCLRPLSTTASLDSGHNKWSKIKHRKGAADAQKVTMRTAHSQLIAMHSRLYGLDSPQLASAVTNAKKAGVPKATIEGAMARGQGRSATGSSLEPLTIEAIMPPGVALIIDIETDKKARSLEDIKVVIRRHKGRASPGAMSFFTRLGRVVFASQPEQDPATQDINTPATAAAPITVDDVLDDAIEAGAEDLEADEDGNIVMWTQPNMTSALTKALGPRFGGRVLSSEIIWKVNDETRARVEKRFEAVALADMLEAVSEFSEVQAIYANVADGGLPEDVWARIEENIDS
ncbi:DUF28 domain-containing protein [Plectosphaerella plurivora]|uniref:DUF28 domain-containing protein n=1 Tax=Plectosphaerella plurivora TaxID=936078 RepID=A0A9P8VKZ1_9PEZI|nr:DUF28 domain-containing protein [Plectosphaerella plurivora]